MANIRSIDMLVIDDLFEMGSGYVLNFSDRTFAQLFATELNVDIDDPAYAKHGTSKAKRLRCFLYTVDPNSAVRTLNALWEYREGLRKGSRREDAIQNAHGQLLAITSRLNAGASGKTHATSTPTPAFDLELYQQFLTELQDLSNLAPHPRGYAFESFLKRLFDKFGLEARDPFRLVGEQIDGSFLLGNETYLLEGKWQNAPSGVDHLHTFHGKVEQKAAWARGLFISYSGFSADGLTAFGRGKRVICMDGYDLSEALMRELSLHEVLERKVRPRRRDGVSFRAGPRLVLKPAQSAAPRTAVKCRARPSLYRGGNSRRLKNALRRLLLARWKRRNAVRAVSTAKSASELLTRIAGS